MFGTFGDASSRLSSYTKVPLYGVVPKGSLTFLGSLLQRSRENYSRNFGLSFRETNRQKKFLPSKNSVLNLECRILSQEPSDSCILYFNVTLHGK